MTPSARKARDIYRIGEQERHHDSPHLEYVLMRSHIFSRRTTRKQSEKTVLVCCHIFCGGKTGKNREICVNVLPYLGESTSRKQSTRQRNTTYKIRARLQPCRHASGLSTRATKIGLPPKRAHKGIISFGKRTAFALVFIFQRTSRGHILLVSTNGICRVVKYGV